MSQKETRTPASCSFHWFFISSPVHAPFEADFNMHYTRAAPGEQTIAAPTRTKTPAPASETPTTDTRNTPQETVQKRYHVVTTRSR